MLFVAVAAFPTNSSCRFVFGVNVAHYGLVQVDLGGVGELSPVLRQPGLPDPDGALRAVRQRRHQPLGPHQVLQRGAARGSAALQPGALPLPLESRGLVRGTPHRLYNQGEEIKYWKMKWNIYYVFLFYYCNLFLECIQKYIW